MVSNIVKMKRPTIVASVLLIKFISFAINVLAIIADGLYLKKHISIFEINRRMKGVYLLLGSNLGNREDMLRRAFTLIEKLIGEIIKASSVYETKAWGIEDQPDFLNQAIEVETKLSPTEILECIQKIEKEMGRKRYQKWGSRIIDIDILYFGQEKLETRELIVPHPENQNRKFVLGPMAEIAPDFEHPILHLSQSELLKRCKDPLPVEVVK
jgi:2-amino-4-hydroxy-6-hydroxymethyldihydropteridine diphosphokinase